MTSNNELHWSFYRHESGKSQQFQREFLNLVGISSTINNDSTEAHYLSLANFGAGYKRLSAKDNDLVIGEVTMQREAVGDDHIGYEVRSINTTSGEDLRLTYVCRNDDYLELHGDWAVQVENSAGDGYRRFACDGTRTTSGAIILDVNGLKPATSDIGNVESAPRVREEHDATSDVTVPSRETSSETDVVSDRFILQWDLNGTDLLLAIDTDLPDAAEVIVSVDRRYYEVGNKEAYGRSYFSEKGRILKWRTPRRVPINDEIWKADLKAHQSKMAALSSDLAFEVDLIEDQISVRAVVHMNQPDSRFGGRGNPNLSGAAVSQMSGSNNWNLVEDQKKIEMPLTGVRPAKRSRNVPYDGLRKDESYRLLSKTSLMAAGPNSVSGSNPKEIMKVLGKTLNIPAGRVVRVVGIDRSSGSNPWYEVEVVGNEGATGWINSTALMRSGVVLE